MPWLIRKLENKYFSASSIDNPRHPGAGTVPLVLEDRALLTTVHQAYKHAWTADGQVANSQIMATDRACSPIQDLARVLKHYRLNPQTEETMTSKLYRYAIIEISNDEKQPDRLVQDFKTEIAPSSELLKQRVLVNEVPELVKSSILDVDRVKIVVTEITI